MSNIDDHADKVIGEAIRRMERQGHKLGAGAWKRPRFQLYRSCIYCNSSVYSWTQNGMFGCIEEKAK